VDLARGHVAALEKLHDQPGCHVFNLGTGRGYSVLEMLVAFARVCGREIPYRIVDRRPGDIGQCYADAERAASVLGWRAQKGLEDMVVDSWRWQSRNPDGYRDISAVAGLVGAVASIYS